MEKDGRLKIIENHCKELMKFFDSVQIFCTKADKDNGGSLANYEYGDGNYLARFGQIKMYVIREEEATRRSVDDD